MPARETERMMKLQDVILKAEGRQVYSVVLAEPLSERVVRVS